MPSSPRWESIRAGLHRLVETYTPDGTRGRLGLAAVAGLVGIYSLMIAFGFLVNPWIGSLLLVPGAAVAGVFLTLLTLVTLWPIYLSLIGHIDASDAYSPDAYSSESETESTPSPTDGLKSQYQRGELSEAEFERELEAVLSETDERVAARADIVDEIRERDDERESEYSGR
ncbi:hypothetical protein [Natronobacterium gregoryi]|uniref:Membrane protein (DUF2078) n=2 Tax=Natronobacterium gregoryi TaxID=44930 RepID=L0AI50_NATGS|nr:hypothetical protein [Natronobacterium gregoryi]AFZ72730.1 putative membrane protein (DUF2078) [Natronobacterium gregoryi SP2]ELY69215.1 hypothetical protein C490_08269 [Natronobacterium gregoryi SP2]PLK18452.1 hypothetical protein CYV19_17935 [Natronobacterium gregoryi SP2]SFJ70922.1 hypothetical protein SAMN05443661_16213 [Natronobacterium gregoryi]